MKTINHIFLFRSNIDVYNEKINLRLENGLTSAFSHHIKQDENGKMAKHYSRSRDLLKDFGCNLNKAQEFLVLETSIGKGIRRPTLARHLPGRFLQVVMIEVVRFN